MDLSIVLGTSMVVAPACKLPAKTLKRGGKMVICNRQKTPFDGRATLVIRGDVDDVLFLLMQELNIEIPDKTPEGFPIHKPTLKSIEEKHAAALKKIKIKSVVARQIEDKLPAFTNAIAKQQNNQFFIKSEKGKKKLKILLKWFTYLCNIQKIQKFI